MVSGVLKSKSLSPKCYSFFKLILIISLLFIGYNFYKNFTSSIRNWPIEDPSVISTSRSYNCLLNLEKNSSITSLYYRHATAERNSSYPFISGDTFRAFADYVFDETKQDKFESLKYGDIVFVKADVFNKFFQGPYDSIKKPFVLVTHNSDFFSPRNFADKLKDQKLIAWYASNPDVRNHSKVFPIPIGLANTRWEFGELKRLTNGFKKYRKPWSNRTTLLYVNFSVRNNPGERQAALSQAQKFKNVAIVDKKISYETYLEQVGNARFVLSPPGNGLDCHRTWEAILMGAVPVVISSGLDPLFKNAPSVILKDWAHLNEKLLLSYKFSSYDNFVSPVLCARYWFQRLLRHRER
ncbi:unnamed protein product [Rotaria magnacalcarata]|uniref:Exostosin GT47 domain-containing protein n=2 Tax=Rotaria magnacalcarata TaxID=392030 RepID=A0A815EUG6_9BILA|nr:unnamed protein product [Rotaria magnacalcarata]CAF1587482.1 unnamed protein product [Rotaria magnacalcarata]CAF2264434.1 unnamed protein product [Rotaria magnacalcarata]CAF3956494.1 unnamed protein product [Rotaria magnacalcarata]CAF4033775.1 unnamed protein product [Rotaria magnacalcarata]